MDHVAFMNGFQRPARDGKSIKKSLDVQVGKETIEAVIGPHTTRDRDIHVYLCLECTW